MLGLMIKNVLACTSFLEKYIYIYMNIRAIKNLQIYLQKRTEILCSIYISESTRKIAQI